MKDNTRGGIMRITQAPTGQAPLSIREKWIGVEIPFRVLETPPEGTIRGIVDMKRIKVGNSFIVDQTQAINALRKKSPEAADWWEDMGFPVPGAEFAFNAGCGEIVS